MGAVSKRFNSRPRRVELLVLCAVLLLPAATFADIPKSPSQYIREHYTKQSYQIAMRDGVRLYTIVYFPRDTSREYPILLTRTPYGVHPYDEDKHRASLGPSGHFLTEKYIFAYQDVRGRYLSEGTFENMRPHQPVKKSKKDIDESSDTFDTIDWMVHNLPNNNGKVGLWGISYPGFYCSAGMIDAHPALKAVSPQAPIADWYFDDFFHHGAFFLTHAFNFFSTFGQPRPEPTADRAVRQFEYGTRDGYKFFQDIGPLKNVNERYYKNDIAYWNTIAEHPTYDAFWKARNLLPHLKKTAPAVMTVGGWYDAEDLYGPLKTYQTIERNDPKAFNVLVMGPWSHGGWARNETKLGDVSFGESNHSEFFQRDVELPFFNQFLKGKGSANLPEALMFETGVNRWRKFDRWPPRNLETRTLHLHPRGKLAMEPTLDNGDAHDAFISDPNRPVPYTERLSVTMSTAYMVDDQRFASKRPDVMVYQTGPLTRDLTLAGPMRAEFYVSTSGTDSDWIVKLIDVFPDETEEGEDAKMSGYQMHVRSEVIRGRYRNSYEKPEPFTPNEPTKVTLELQDVLHTFRKGHRLMVQVHSSWFPLVDRNPQRFVPNIFHADEKDFIVTQQRIHRSTRYPSALRIGVLPASPGP